MAGPPDGPELSGSPESDPADSAQQQADAWWATHPQTEAAAPDSQTGGSAQQAAEPWWATHPQTEAAVAPTQPQAAAAATHPQTEGAAQQQPGQPAWTPHPQTEAAATSASHPWTQAPTQRSPSSAASPQPPTDVVRYGPGVPATATVTGAGAGAATVTVTGAAAATLTGPAGQTAPAAWPDASRPPGMIRQGPGVPAVPPASQAALTAEQVWRTGRLPQPAGRRRRLRQTASTALTVVLLVASVIVIYLRLHHGPLSVTGVAITGQVKRGCTVDVTGRIDTSGAAGIVSYQWLFQPQLEAPRPQNQSVVAGQNAVYVTAAVEGQGHGSIAQTVTLQVLGPGQGTASARMVVSC